MEFFSVDLFDKLDEGDCRPACDFFNQNPEFIEYYYYGKSLLHHFAKEDFPELLAVLVDLGMDVNVEQENYPWGPLGSAVVAGKLNSARWLLEHRAQTTEQHKGLTFSCGTLWSVASGNFEMVKLLVEHGAPVDILVDDPPRSLLTTAIAYGHTEIADYLRSRGALEADEIHRKRGEPSTKVVIDHITTHFGPPTPLAQQQIVSGEPAISIHLIPPTGKRKRVALVTTGMSDKPLTIPEGQDEYQFAELFLDLPGDWPVTPKKLAASRFGWPLDCLRRLVRYPHDLGISLGGPRAVVANGDPPKPIAPGVPFTAFLLLTSGQPEDRLALADGRVVHFYRVFPLYPEEYHLERTQGTEALLQRFQKQKIAMTADPKRKNVAKV